MEVAMRKVIVSFLKKIGFSGLESLPSDLVIPYARERAIILLRGILRFRKFCFLGKGVEIKCKRKIIMGRFVTIHTYTYIDACSEKGIILEDYCTIGKHNYERSGYLNNPSGYLVMKKNSSTNYGCFIGATGGIIIGKNVLIGPKVTIISESHIFDSLEDPIKAQGVKNFPVEIANDVWTGTNTTILGGVRIGEHSIIGAYSLVNKNVSPYQIVVGIPAKSLKNREDESSHIS